MTDTHTTRWAFWGAGKVAQEVAADLALVPGARLHAVGSRRLARARAFADRFRTERAVDNLRAIATDPTVDVVYIATPNHCHLPDALSCLEAGKAVLLEKPFALDRAQAAQLVETARARGVFLMEAMWSRFIPAIRALRDQVQAGAIGAVSSLTADFSFPAPREQARLFEAAMGGGALLDLGVYSVSLAHSLLGTPTGVLSTAQFRGGEVDEQLSALLTFEGGASAQITASLIGLGSNQAVVTGDRGRLTLPPPFYKASRLGRVHYDVRQAEPPAEEVQALRGSLHHRLQGPKQHLSPLRELASDLRSQRFPFAGYGYQFQLEEVQACLARGATESAVMPLDDSLAVMGTLDAIRACWAR